MKWEYNTGIVCSIKIYNSEQSKEVMTAIIETTTPDMLNCVWSEIDVCWVTVPMLRSTENEL
jgi:hypothetical protein